MGAKAVRKRRSQDELEATVQLRGRYHQRKAKNANQALKEAHEELKEMYGEENIISAVIHTWADAPHLRDFVY